MYEIQSFTARARPGLLAAALLLGASPASAASFFFDSPSGFGVSAATASGTGLDSMTAPLHAYSSFLAVTNQSPQLPVMGVPSAADPNMISTTWTVQNSTSAALIDVYLVLIQPINYDSTLAGLETSGGSWKFIEVDEDIFYPAVSLGDLAAGGTVMFSFTHLIATSLLMDGPDYVAPQYSAGVTFSESTVPEPAHLILLSGAIIGFALWRRQES